MKSVAVFNNKGGVGKTTLLCNLASHLALKSNYRVAVIDADPQCNATQALFPAEVIEELYVEKRGFTLGTSIRPRIEGAGPPKLPKLRASKSFGVDVLPGDPGISRNEDVLASGWTELQSGKPRGFNVTFLFRQLLDVAFDDYDFVFFDVGPSLGAINRAVLAACDYYVTPMSIDIFSLMALENISASLVAWHQELARAVESTSPADLPEGADLAWRLKFVGYVTQQYTFRRDAEGKPRGVAAYRTIEDQIPKTVEETILRGEAGSLSSADALLGTIPNLHSLVPLSQTARRPIFELGAHDGIVGAHFSKVAQFEALMASISERLLANIELLEQAGPRND